MPSYVTLVKFSDQGIRNVKETTKRAKAFVEMAGNMGIKVRELCWTMGSYDLVTITEAPDEEAATAMLLTLGAMGNVHTETLRAYSSAEVDRILAKMP